MEVADSAMCGWLANVMMGYRSYLLVALASVLFWPGFASAHPVPRSNHDRTVLVQLAAPGDQQLAVVVHYRLEVDELTVLLEDMVPFYESVNPADYQKRRDDFYRAYMRCYAPILASHLLARLGTQPLTFTCQKYEHSLKDEKGQELGHLRCDYVFAAAGTLHAHQDTAFSFYDENYEGLPGKSDVSLKIDKSLSCVDQQQASEELKAKEPTQWQAGDEKQLRQVTARIGLPRTAASNTPHPQPFSPEYQGEGSGEKGNTSPPTSANETSPTAEDHPAGLLDLFRADRYSFPVLLLIAAMLGAAHALTPGHGKTLVAAYLVGERGTVLHALVLGLVTTLTHTSVVIILALVLFLVPMDEAMRRVVQSGLGLSMGLVVVCLGFWLLLQRAAGRADHVHLGGHGHHHHHGSHHHPPHDHTHADHAHDEHGHVVPQAVGWWGLIILGMSGGIIPCWDAIALLMVAIAGNLIHLALPLVLAFSAGLAGVLVAIGILVVKVKGFATSHIGGGTLTRVLPLVSAMLLVAIGFWLCYDAVHGVH